MFICGNGAFVGWKKGYSLSRGKFTLEEYVIRTLVVEHDVNLSKTTVSNLRRNGYDADSVGTGKAALDEAENADLVLLALDLPDLDGLEVCRQIRAICDTPIISVTDGGTELDRVLGLQAGSDDCINKPYGLRELIARIEAVMRRTRPKPAFQGSVICHGQLYLDCAGRKVRVSGKDVKVTRKEFDLLYLLLSQREKVVSREQLMTRVWGNEWAKNGRTIDTHVSSLRSKLGASSWITTVHGVGYRIGHE
ncbi:DNA-binding response regulator [Nocardiopsis ansamitocini]|uniref:DNA-binding response regulator n=1 Tax=Nocardiopsis ansamitocini TaxID=1670832 RepID=A0A9W6UJF1_9ACTN|nr:DNA-binding response regulator [Nocardiopsis ansamitocini]